MNEEKPLEELSFREAMSELESEVKVLESNTLELEDSLKSYARGVQLVTLLQGRIADAEQQIQMLTGQLEQSVDDASRDTTLS